MVGTPLYLWVVLLAVIVAAVTVDFLVFHRKASEVTLRAALIESAAWICLALSFNGSIYWLKVRRQACSSSRDTWSKNR